jgi:hypothetical protein
MALWSFVSVARIEQHFGQWYALVTLEKDAQESMFIKFDAEPTTEQAAAAGQAMALRRNLDEAPSAPGDSITREDFFGRFTNAEIAAIYQAAGQSADLFAYLKKAEINPSVNRKNEDAIAGLQLLEAVGLLGPGRAAEILKA